MVLTLSVGVATLAALWFGPVPAPATASTPAPPVGVPYTAARSTDPRPATRVPESRAVDVPAALAALAATGPPSHGTPSGVSAAQWQQLTAEIQSRPDGPAELQRLASYLDWSELLRRFRETRAAGGDAVDLARSLERGLDERLRQRELSAAEAQRVKSAILEVTVADAAERQQQLQQWTAATLRPATPDPRQLQFDRGQAAIVSAWSARPPSARDPSALARELDTLRRQTFTPTGR